jgi:hypothetical protein
MIDQQNEIAMAILDGLMQHGVPVRAAREAAGITFAGVPASIFV